MSIWKQSISVEEVNRRGKGTLSEYLGIRYTSVSDTGIEAEIQVYEHHLQPAGIMNGGVSCAIAESVASAASNYCCDADEFCVGIDINTNHIAPAVHGDLLLARASPHHIGKTTQVWSIEIRQINGRLISISRLTLLTKKKH